MGQGREERGLVREVKQKRGIEKRCTQEWNRDKHGDCRHTTAHMPAQIFPGGGRQQDGRQCRVCDSETDIMCDRGRCLHSHRTHSGDRSLKTE